MQVPENRAASNKTLSRSLKSPDCSQHDAVQKFLAHLHALAPVGLVKVGVTTHTEVGYSRVACLYAAPLAIRMLAHARIVGSYDSAIFYATPYARFATSGG